MTEKQGMKETMDACRNTGSNVASKDKELLDSLGDGADKKELRTVTIKK